MNDDLGQEVAALDDLLEFFEFFLPPVVAPELVVGDAFDLEGLGSFGFKFDGHGCGIDANGLQSIAQGGETDDDDAEGHDPPAFRDEPPELPEVERGGRGRGFASGWLGVVVKHGEAGFRYGADFSEHPFADGDHVAGQDFEEGTFVFGAGCAGVEAVDFFLTLFEALHGDFAGGAEPGVAAGHGDGLQKIEGLFRRDFVGAGALDFAENGAKVFGVFDNRQGDLWVDEVVFGQQGADMLPGLLG
ncbi:MAG: hypothetical protein PCFJNLEI_02241 [Verrucomicrobiae bacterium]|nr:hypothetical protein [Verrucomicrobiae bacterium]